MGETKVEKFLKNLEKNKETGLQKGSEQSENFRLIAILHEDLNNNNGEIHYVKTAESFSLVNTRLLKRGKELKVTNSKRENVIEVFLMHLLDTLLTKRRGGIDILNFLDEEEARIFCHFTVEDKVNVSFNFSFSGHGDNDVVFCEALNYSTNSKQKVEWYTLDGVLGVYRTLLKEL